MRASYALTIVLCLSIGVISGCAKAPQTPAEQVQSLLTSGDSLGAIDLSTKLLLETPEDVDLLYFRAQSYVTLEMYDEAVADCTQIIRLKPDEPKGYYSRELAYRRAGKTELANADGTKGRQLDVEYKTAYLYEQKNFSSRSRVVEGEGSEPGNDRSDSNDGELADIESGFDDEPWSVDTEGSGELSDDEIADAAYDPINHASSILDRALNDDVAHDDSIAGKPPKVAEESAREAAAAELQSNIARFEAGNVANNQADNRANRTRDIDEEDDAIAKLIERRFKGNRAGEALLAPKPFVPDEPTQMPENFIMPPRPQISTALPTAPVNNTNANAIPGAIRPLGMPSVPGIGAPRATGINSAPVARTMLPTNVGGNWVGGIAGTPQSNALQPGQYQGNTIYTPGSPSPSLSTSLPGTGTIAPAAPGFVPQNLGATRGIGSARARGPILSTQLPPNRVVSPLSTGRSTGIHSNPAYGQ